MFNLPDLPTRVEPLITQAAQRSLERGSHARHHGILGLAFLQDFQNRPVSKARIGSHPQLTDVGGNRQKGTGQQLAAAGPCACITGPQFGIPQERRIGFQTQ